MIQLYEKKPMQQNSSTFKESQQESRLASSTQNVGIVGCGHIARFHLNEIKKIGNTNLVGLVDSNSERLQTLSEEFNIPNVYNSIDELLKDTKPDVVHILTPPATHSELSIKAMRYGCHVFVEKPMALTSQEAMDMIEAAEKCEVKLCVGHNLLFEPVVRKVHEIVNSFEFGDLVHLEALFIFDTNRLKQLENIDEKLSEHWLRSLKGGLLRDLAPHPLSLMLNFLRGIKKVYSIKKQVDRKSKFGIDELRVLIDSDVATANISMSLRAKPDNIILNLYGTKMTIRVDVSNMIFVKQKLYNVPKKVSRGIDNLSQSFQISSQTINNAVKFATGRIKDAGGLGNIIREFYRSIDLNTLPPVTGQEGAAVVELMSKIWK